MTKMEIRMTAALEKKMMRMMINGGGECAYQD